MRKLILVLLLTVPLALVGCQDGHRSAAASNPQSAIANPQSVPPYTRVVNPDSNTFLLQIALRRFVPARGRSPSIWLAATMHVGEPEYYRAVQKYLDARTVVLYEGVNTDSHPRHVNDSGAKVREKSPDTDGGYSMQATMAKSLGLVFQLDAIDYDRTNFLNSDLSVAQIQRVMNSAPPTPSSPPASSVPATSSSPPASSVPPARNNPSFDALLQIMDGSSFLGGLFKVGLQYIGANPYLQGMAKLTLIEAVGNLKGDLSEMRGLPPDLQQLVRVLIEARNEKVIADLKTELKQVPRNGSIAVFYGTGHMDDLERRLGRDLHYQFADEVWLSAFSLDLRKSGITPAEAQTIRNLVKIQLSQMQP